MHHVYLMIAIASEVVATTALKSAEGFTRLGPSVIVAGRLRLRPSISSRSRSSVSRWASRTRSGREWASS